MKEFKSKFYKTSDILTRYGACRHYTLPIESMNNTCFIFLQAVVQ